MSLLSQDIAIRVENVSKVYPARARLFSSSDNGDISAIKNLSFEVPKGEVLGLIGRNGSGKSTLLRILSGIEKPSAGRILIQGKTAAVLNIGSGFHPDLTGRENVYFRGQLLGISKKEVQAKFDEIVAFSGIGSFIDTPVKHYSDGMYLRLAFSTLVHANADIMLFDEVLAVGDIDFQAKSRQRIREMVAQGTTVLIASHAMEEIVSICDRVLNVGNGNYSLGLPSKEVSDFRHNLLQPAQSKNEIDDELVEYLALEHGGNAIFFKDKFYLSFKPRHAVGQGYGFAITSSIGVVIIMSMVQREDIERLSDGTFCIEIDSPLNIGRYYIDFFVLTPSNTILRAYREALSFDIESNEAYYEFGNHKTPFFLWEHYKTLKSDCNG